jgi:hypothetical protein
MVFAGRVFEMNRALMDESGMQRETTVTVISLE